MQATLYHDINILLDILLSRMQAILGEKLVGLYLDGSLVIGDFDPYISDIDLVAALSADIDDREFEELPEWSQLIQNALAWREAWRDDDVDYEVTHPETVQFVMFVRYQVEREK